MAIGTFLRAARELAGLNRVQAARAIGLEYTQLQRYEANQNTPGPVILIRMADAYGVSTDALLGRTPLVTLPCKTMEAIDAS